MIEDRFFKSGMIMILTAFIAGFLNIGFRIGMGRLLSPEEFGEFSAVFSLSFFISYIQMKTVRVAMTGIVSSKIGNSGFTAVKKKYCSLFKRLVLVGTFTGALLFLCVPTIASFIKIEKFELIYPLSVIVLISWLLPLNLGTFQGLQRFVPLGSMNIIRATVKIVVGISLVYFGMSSLGAIIGMVIGIGVAYIVSQLIVMKILSGDHKELKDHNSDDWGRTASIYVMISVIGLTCLTNIDVVLIKHFFSSVDTANYTAASLVGRVISFFPVGFITVMIPNVIRRNKDQREAIKVLRKTLVLTLIPIVIISIGAIVFPKVYLNTLYGGKYNDAVDLVRYFSLLMFIFSIISILVNYQLAMKKKFFISLFTIATLFSMMMIIFFHETLVNILIMLITVNLIILIIGLFSMVPLLRGKSYG